MSAGRNWCWTILVSPLLKKCYFCFYALIAKLIPRVRRYEIFTEVSLLPNFYDSIKVAGDMHGIEFIETFATSTYSTTKQNLTIN